MAIASYLAGLGASPGSFSSANRGLSPCGEIYALRFILFREPAARFKHPDMACFDSQIRVDRFGELMDDKF